MFSEKWKKPNFSHLPLFKISSVETKNTKAFYKVAIFGRLNFYNLNVFNLFNLTTWGHIFVYICNMLYIYIYTHRNLTYTHVHIQ